MSQPTSVMTAQEAAAQKRRAKILRQGLGYSEDAIKAEILQEHHKQGDKLKKIDEITESEIIDVLNKRINSVKSGLNANDSLYEYLTVLDGYSQTPASKTITDLTTAITPCNSDQVDFSQLNFTEPNPLAGIQDRIWGLKFTEIAESAEEKNAALAEISELKRKWKSSNESEVKKKLQVAEKTSKEAITDSIVLLKKSVESMKKKDVVDLDETAQKNPVDAALRSLQKHGVSLKDLAGKACGEKKYETPGDNKKHMKTVKKIQLGSKIDRKDWDEYLSYLNSGGSGQKLFAKKLVAGSAGFDEKIKYLEDKMAFDGNSSNTMKEYKAKFTEKSLHSEEEKLNFLVSKAPSYVRTAFMEKYILSDEEKRNLVKLDALIEEIIGFVKALAAHVNILVANDEVDTVEAFKKVIEFLENQMKAYMTLDQANDFSNAANQFLNKLEQACAKYSKVRDDEVLVKKSLMLKSGNTNIPIIVNGELNPVIGDNTETIENAIKIIEQKINEQYHEDEKSKITAGILRDASHESDGRLVSSHTAVDQFVARDETLRMSIVEELGKPSASSLEPSTKTTPKTVVQARTEALNAINSGRKELKDALAALRSLKAKAEDDSDLINKYEKIKSESNDIITNIVNEGMVFTDSAKNKTPQFQHTKITSYGNDTEKTLLENAKASVTHYEENLKTIDNQIEFLKKQNTVIVNLKTRKTVCDEEYEKRQSHSTNLNDAKGGAEFSLTQLEKTLQNTLYEMKKLKIETEFQKGLSQARVESYKAFENVVETGGVKEHSATEIGTAKTEQEMNSSEDKDVEKMNNTVYFTTLLQQVTEVKRLIKVRNEARAEEKNPNKSSPLIPAASMATLEAKNEDNVIIEMLNEPYQVAEEMVTNADKSIRARNTYAESIRALATDLVASNTDAVKKDITAKKSTHLQTKQKIENRANAIEACGRAERNLAQKREGNPFGVSEVVKLELSKTQESIDNEKSKQTNEGEELQKTLLNALTTFADSIPKVAVNATEKDIKEAQNEVDELEKKLKEFPEGIEKAVTTEFPSQYTEKFNLAIQAIQAYKKAIQVAALQVEVGKHVEVKVDPIKLGDYRKKTDQELVDIETDSKNKLKEADKILTCAEKINGEYPLVDEGVRNAAIKEIDRVEKQNAQAMPNQSLAAVNAENQIREEISDKVKVAVAPANKGNKDAQQVIDDYMNKVTLDAQSISGKTIKMQRESLATAIDKCNIAEKKCTQIFDNLSYNMPVMSPGSTGFDDYKNGSAKLDALLNSQKNAIYHLREACINLAKTAETAITPDKSDLNYQPPGEALSTARAVLKELLTSYAVEKIESLPESQDDKGVYEAIRALHAAINRAYTLGQSADFDTEFNAILEGTNITRGSISGAVNEKAVFINDKKESTYNKNNENEKSIDDLNDLTDDELEHETDGFIKKSISAQKSYEALIKRASVLKRQLSDEMKGVAELHPNSAERISALENYIKDSNEVSKKVTTNTTKQSEIRNTYLVEQKAVADKFANKLKSGPVFEAISFASKSDENTEPETIKSMIDVLKIDIALCESQLKTLSEPLNQKKSAKMDNARKVSNETVEITKDSEEKALASLVLALTTQYADIGTILGLTIGKFIPGKITLGQAETLVSEMHGLLGKLTDISNLKVEGVDSDNLNYFSETVDEKVKLLEAMRLQYAALISSKSSNPRSIKVNNPELRPLTNMELDGLKDDAQNNLNGISEIEQRVKDSINREYTLIDESAKEDLIKSITEKETQIINEENQPVIDAVEEEYKARSAMVTAVELASASAFVKHAEAAPFFDFINTQIVNNLLPIDLKSAELEKIKSALQNAIDQNEKTISEGMPEVWNTHDMKRMKGDSTGLNEFKKTTQEVKDNLDLEQEAMNKLRAACIASITTAIENIMKESPDPMFVENAKTLLNNLTFFKVSQIDADKPVVALIGALENAVNDFENAKKLEEAFKDELQGLMKTAEDTHNELSERAKKPTSDLKTKDLEALKQVAVDAKSTYSNVELTSPGVLQSIDNLLQNVKYSSISDEIKKGLAQPAKSLINNTYIPAADDVLSKITAEEALRNQKINNIKEADQRVSNQYTTLQNEDILGDQVKKPEKLKALASDVIEKRIGLLDKAIDDCDKELQTLSDNQYEISDEVTREYTTAYNSITNKKTEEIAARTALQGAQRAKLDDAKNNFNKAAQAFAELLKNPATNPVLSQPNPFVSPRKNLEDAFQTLENAPKLSENDNSVIDAKNEMIGLILKELTLRARTANGIIVGQDKYKEIIGGKSVGNVDQDALDDHLQTVTSDNLSKAIKGFEDNSEFFNNLDEEKTALLQKYDVVESKDLAAEFKVANKAHSGNAITILKALKEKNENVANQQEEIKLILETVLNLVAEKKEFKKLNWDPLVQYMGKRETVVNELEKIRININNIIPQNENNNTLLFNAKESVKEFLRDERNHLLKVKAEKCVRVQDLNNGIIAATHNAALGLDVITSNRVKPLAADEDFDEKIYLEDLPKSIAEKTKLLDDSLSALENEVARDDMLPEEKFARDQLLNNLEEKVRLLEKEGNALVASRRINDKKYGKPEDAVGNSVDINCDKMDRLKQMYQQKIALYNAIDKAIEKSREYNSEILGLDYGSDLHSIKQARDEKLGEIKTLTGVAKPVYSQASITLDTLLTSGAPSLLNKESVKQIVNAAKSVVDGFVHTAEAHYKQAADEDLVRDNLVEITGVINDVVDTEYGTQEVQSAIHLKLDSIFDLNDASPHIKVLQKAIENCNQNLEKLESLEQNPSFAHSDKVKGSNTRVAGNVVKIRDEYLNALSKLLNEVTSQLTNEMKEVESDYINYFNKLIKMYDSNFKKIPYPLLKEFAARTAEYINKLNDAVTSLESASDSYLNAAIKLPDALNESLKMFRDQIYSLNENFSIPCNNEIRRRDQIAVIEVMKARAKCVGLVGNFPFELFKPLLGSLDRAVKIDSTTPDDYIGWFVNPINQNDFISNVQAQSDEADGLLRAFLSSADKEIDTLLKESSKILSDANLRDSVNKLLDAFADALLDARVKLGDSINALTIPYDSPPSNHNLNETKRRRVDIDNLLAKVERLLVMLATPVVNLDALNIANTTHKDIVARNNRDVYEHILELDDIELENAFNQLVGRDGYVQISAGAGKRPYTLMLAGPLVPVDAKYDEPLFKGLIQVSLEEVKRQYVEVKTKLGKGQSASAQRYTPENNRSNRTGAALRTTDAKEAYLIAQVHGSWDLDSVKDVPKHVKEDIAKARSEYTSVTESPARADLYNLTLKQNDNGKHVVKVYPPKTDGLTDGEMVELWNNVNKTEPFVVEVDSKYFLVTAKEEVDSNTNKPQIGYYKRALSATDVNDAKTEAVAVQDRGYDAGKDQSFTADELSRNPEIGVALQEHIANEIIIKNKNHAVLKTVTDVSAKRHKNNRI
jgi:hypothetical protein